MGALFFLQTIDVMMGDKLLIYCFTIVCGILLVSCVSHSTVYLSYPFFGCEYDHYSY
jgi:hypothetical protein